MRKSKLVLIMQIGGVIVLVIGLLAMAYGIWLGETKSFKRAAQLSPKEEARNADTSNFDTVLRF